MAQKFGKTFSQAATWTIDIACKGFDGAALDITLHEKHILLSRRGVAAVDLSSTVASANFIAATAGDWTTGLLRIKLRPADHEDLTTGGVYFAEIWTEAPDGTVYDQAHGTIAVRKSGIHLAA